MRAARYFKLSKDSLQHKCTSLIAWLHAPLPTAFRLPMVERDAEFNSRAAAVVEPAAISRAAQCADASVTR